MWLLQFQYLSYDDMRSSNYPISDEMYFSEMIVDFASHFISQKIKDSWRAKPCHESYLEFLHYVERKQCFIFKSEWLSGAFSKLELTGRSSFLHHAWRNFGANRVSKHGRYRFCRYFYPAYGYWVDSRPCIYGVDTMDTFWFSLTQKRALFRVQFGPQNYPLSQNKCAII